MKEWPLCVMRPLMEILFPRDTTAAIGKKFWGEIYREMTIDYQEAKCRELINITHFSNS